MAYGRACPREQRQVGLGVASQLAGGAIEVASEHALVDDAMRPPPLPGQPRLGLFIGHVVDAHECAGAAVPVGVLLGLKDHFARASVIARLPEWHEYLQPHSAKRPAARRGRNGFDVRAEIGLRLDAPAAGPGSQPGPTSYDHLTNDCSLAL